MIAGLPYDSEVEYLESTGTQWIDTGIHATQNTTAKIKCAWTNTTNDHTVFGADNGSTWTGFILQQNTGIRFVKGGPTNTFAQRWNLFVAGQTYDIECSQNGVVIDGTLYSFNGTPTSEFYVNKPIALFGWWRNTQPWGSNVRISYVQFFENGTLIRDYIPVRYTNSNGQSEGAMYDRVSRKLFRNAGAGAFTIGPDVATPVMGLHFFKSQMKTAKDYVQNGLIAMWDGIENVGYGQHDDNATSWIDLTGGGANWLLKDSHTPEMFEVGSDYVKILSTIGYDGRGYCSPSWTSVDDLVSCEIVFDADNVDMTTITNTRRVVGFMESGSGKAIYFQIGFISCGYNQYPCAAITQGVYSMSFDFGVQRAMLNGVFFESTRKGPGAISSIGPSLSGYGYGDAYCAVGAKIKALRVYGRSLSDAERLANYAVDRVRFNLPSSS